MYLSLLFLSRRIIDAERRHNPPGTKKAAAKGTFNSNVAIEIGRTEFPVGVHEIVRFKLLILQSNKKVLEILKMNPNQVKKGPRRKKTCRPDDEHGGTMFQLSGGGVARNKSANG